MTTESLYQRCLPILGDVSLDDDDRVEKLENFIHTETSLSGKALENSVLDILWRWKSSKDPDSMARPSSRITIIKKASPAPWQVARVPSPSLSSSLPMGTIGTLGTLSPSPSFLRSSISNTASPFTSPRASPRLAFATPIPHSPRLDAYLPFTTETSPKPEEYEDLGFDSFEWLTGDDDSTVSSLFTDSLSNETVNAIVMDPHDMLRSVFGEEFSNDILEKHLKENNYDISTTMSALIESRGLIEPVVEPIIPAGTPRSPKARPVTPASQSKTTVICRYYLSNGSCSRADCKFSHDTSSTVCRYWLQGTCLAGDTCVFSHDPAVAFSKLTHGTQTPPRQPKLHDLDAFPNLPSSKDATKNGNQRKASSATALNPLANFTPNSASRPSSRPNSRSATPSVSLDDSEAFPSLASASNRKRQQGRKGHGASYKEPSSSQSDATRITNSPTPNNRGKSSHRSRLGGSRDFNPSIISTSSSSPPSTISPPGQLPWVATGDNANKAYVKARAEAFKHASQRNKLLQGAAQAYNRKDARSAKALSLRGQAENALMREAHRKAAQILYDEVNEDVDQIRELYVDLHGLHPEEAVEHLVRALCAHKSDVPMRPIYAITGNGHNTRNGKDKLSKAIKNYLHEARYVFREFAGTGDRSSMGGVIGIDPSSGNINTDVESAKNICIDIGLTPDDESVVIPIGLGATRHERTISTSSEKSSGSNGGIPGPTESIEELVALQKEG